MRLKLHLVVENSYFKDQDFSANPVKKYLKSYSFQALDNRGLYYYMMVSENDVYTHDYKLFGKEKSYTYVETRIEHNEVRLIDDFKGTAFVSIYIMLDN